jgi:hypothetical protein
VSHDAGAPGPAIPRSLKAAALCFLLFAVAVLLNSATQSAAGWMVPRRILHSGFRVVGAGAVAWGLLRGARWAWVLGLLLGSFWLVTGLLTVLVLDRLIGPGGRAVALACRAAGAPAARCLSTCGRCGC